MLKLVHGVLWGRMRTAETWPDMTFREGLILVPMAFLVLWLGLYPIPYLEPLREPVRLILEGTQPLAAMQGGLP
jgi:NADH-quinone oxidoreductase subunit M